MVRTDRPGQFSTAIAQLGHINERVCWSWVAAAPDDPERVDMAALFGELVDRPLTQAVIDEMWPPCGDRATRVRATQACGARNFEAMLIS